MSSNVEEQAILLKGSGAGIKMVISESASDEQIIDELAKFPSQAFDVAVGDGIMVDLQARPCTPTIIVRLLSELVWERKLRITSWNSFHASTIECLKLAGLPLAGGIKELKREPDNSSLAPTLFLVRSLRSGQKIEHNGDVVLVGHVNGGAEIYAGGSIAVLGKLKGMVHAGMALNKEKVSYIYAHSFEPQQIRIGGLMDSKITSDMPWWSKSVIIVEENGSLIVRDI